MAKVFKMTDGIIWDCPGCEISHKATVGGPDGWVWNGDVDKPTLKPSFVAEYGEGKVCHSYITDGKIQFLNDSYHPLAGKTVEMPDWEN